MRFYYYYYLLSFSKQFVRMVTSFYTINFIRSTPSWYKILLEKKLNIYKGKEVLHWNDQQILAHVSLALSTSSSHNKQLWYSIFFSCPFRSTRANSFMNRLYMMKLNTHIKEGKNVSATSNRFFRKSLFPREVIVSYHSLREDTK